MLPYDKSILDALTNATACSTQTTIYINSDYIEISGKRFSTKQLAYLLSKLLDEHPECQV